MVQMKLVKPADVSHYNTNGHVHTMRDNVAINSFCHIVFGSLVNKINMYVGDFKDTQYADLR